MSELFRVDVSDIMDGMDTSGEVRDWSQKDINASALITQIGILERLELMIKLQAFTLSTSIPNKRIKNVEGQEVIRVLKHYGYESE